MKGSPQDEPGRSEDSRNHDEDDLPGPGGSQVEVSVPRFTLGAYEITNREFQAFIEDAGYEMPGGCMADLHGDGTWDRYPEATWNNIGRPFANAHPASCIDWHAADAYARWLSLRTGAPYRLPTESEFEYARRAGSSARFHFGDDQEEWCRYGNVPDAALNALDPAGHTLQCDDGYPSIAPVGRFEPNAFGVYDMTDNVWEWLADCYEPSYANAPTDGSALIADPCEARSIRGGSWGYDLPSLRSADRSDDPPAVLYDGIGFRVARDLLGTSMSPVALAPDWDLRVYDDRERGFSFLYPAKLQQSESGGNVVFAAKGKDVSYIVVNLTKNNPRATVNSLAEAFAESMEGEVVEVASKQVTLRDGVTDAVEVVVDWQHPGTEFTFRTVYLSTLLGDQRASVGLTNRVKADWGGWRGRNRHPGPWPSSSSRRAAAVCAVGIHSGAGHRPIAARERKIGNSARTRASISSLTWRGT